MFARLTGTRNRISLGDRLAELTILVTARENDVQNEWTAHEPAGLKAGLDPQTIDIVKYRKPIAGVPDKEAAIIKLGREVFGSKKEVRRPMRKRSRPLVSGVSRITKI
jgi:hypothetical protein